MLAVTIILTILLFAATSSALYLLGITRMQAKLMVLQAREGRHLRRDLRERQGKVLQKANLTPLYHVPAKPTTQPDPPPIGVTASRALQFQRDRTLGNGVASEEQILSAAARASANGNG
jgi:hypothetical protein